MGDVYLAEDKKLGRKVALKVLRAESVTHDRLRRFDQEAKALAVNHPNIVHVYSVEASDGVHFITMEWVRGQTLRGRSRATVSGSRVFSTSQSR